MSVFVNYVSDNNQLLSSDLTNIGMILAPDAPAVYDSIGQINWENNTFQNPIARLTRKYNALTNNLLSNINLGYTILPGLQLKLNLGYNDMTLDELQTMPTSSVYPPYRIYYPPQSYFNTGSVQTWIVEPQAEYQRKIGKGRLGILIGSTIQQTDNASTTLWATGFSSDQLLENIAAASSIVVQSNIISTYKYDAVFCRINYNWEDKYIVNLTGRRDGSSRFGPGKQFANFGAIGGAWIFSKEHFIQDNLPAISFGKLRASYGLTGNDQIGDYQYLSAYGATIYPYQGNPGLTPLRFYNPNYSWETNRKFETGLELGFVKDRILLVTSYFNNLSSNQLVGYPLPLLTGEAYVQANLPATVKNNGWEFEVNTVTIKSRYFSWTSSFNVTIPHNCLVSFPGLESSSYANTFVIGKSLQTVKAFHVTGVDPSTGLYSFATKSGSGDPIYPDDLKGMKQIGQTLFGGFQNSFHYKNWSTDIFFQFVQQTGRSSAYINVFTSPGQFSGGNGNEPVQVLDRWRKPGNITSQQQFSQSYDAPYSAWFNAIYQGDLSIVNSSFVRLKNVAITYQVPNAWTQKMHLLKMSLYVQGQNLLTFTKYIGPDPETTATGQLPPLRVFTGGIKISL